MLVNGCFAHGLLNTCTSEEVIKGGLTIATCGIPLTGNCQITSIYLECFVRDGNFYFMEAIITSSYENLRSLLKLAEIS